MLDNRLEILWRYIMRPKLIEIAAVRPGELLMEFAGRDEWVAEEVPALTLDYWEALARNLAHLDGVTYDADTAPIVSTKLPGGHRVEMFLGRWVESHISVSIRIYRDLELTVEHFGVKGAVADRIRAAIRGRLNIIVSGGTSSGKTTLTNALLKEIPSAERVLTVEDVRELRLKHLHNRGHYAVDRHGRGVQYDRILDHLMRSSPGRIICGELSMRNASAVLLLFSTGHRGFLTTLHCNGCYEALHSAFHDRVALSGVTVDRDYLTDYLRRNVDLVIQVAKTPRGRRITELWAPAEEEAPTILEGGGHD